MLRYIGSVLLIIGVSSFSFGQNRSYLPSAYRVGLDLTGVGVTLLRSGHSHIELNNDLQFGKYFFSADLGTVGRTFERETFNYEFSGRFFRAGLDYNFLHKDPDDNVIFLGLRYGRAYFNDQMQLVVSDAIFGTQAYELQNNQLRGRWIEAAGGMKIRVWNDIFLGYTLRLKFAPNVRGETNLFAYEIPGYGKAGRNNTFAFNYHIFYRIPFLR